DQKADFHLVRTHLVNGAVMLSEAKHPATSNGKIVRPKLWMYFESSWVLRCAQNDKDDMSTNLISSGTTARQKVNLRTPDVMAAVQQQVESHYRSDIIEKIRGAGGIISVGDTTVRLAKQFGFCYGVERAIDLAYAARKVFKDRRLFIVGEIIHNPEVNHQIASLGIKNLTGKNKQADISDLGPDDVVIVPAF